MKICPLSLSEIWGQISTNKDSMKTGVVNSFLMVLCITMSCIAFSATNMAAQNLKSDKGHETNPYYSTTDTAQLHLSDADWKKVLPRELYLVARKNHTEKPFTGKYWNSSTRGTYYCACCGNTLFKSDAKFASTCGWPSFYEPLRKTSVRYLEDHSLGIMRTEVRCGRCDAHLGHIFDDGPPPTYKRFCMNSISLDFEPAGDQPGSLGSN